MRTHAEIVKEAGPVEAVALRHGVSVHTVKSWIQRNSIPRDHWMKFTGGNAGMVMELLESANRKNAA